MTPFCLAVAPNMGATKPEQEKDGTPDDALFDEPWGVAVDEEGTIYIADTKNKCIRKLAIQ